MPKSHRKGVVLNRSDIWRTLVTDTVPFEVPIIYSNDGLYRNLSDYDNKSPKLKELIDALILKERRFTIPLRYNIVNDAQRVRTLSLLHPHGQVQLAQFYDNYNHLICEYGQRSPYSIRKPAKIGAYFFLPSSLSEKKKYKQKSIDTLEIDKVARNPASYFSYSGFDRLYKFFLSDDYVRLEKRYRFQRSLDIGKCFDSIYTHSIAWAVKSMEMAKKNIHAHSFGNDFDKVMRSVNYNETSGICIGPEASRIFAEIILAKVDEIVFDELNKQGYKEKTDYQCRRYVDDYFIFSNSEDMLARVNHELSIALRLFKLHLNEQKSETLSRPFYSRKSLAIDRAKLAIENHLDIEKLLSMRATRLTSNSKDRTVSPHKTRSHRAIFGSLTREVKAACYSSEMGYDSVANYLISIVVRKIIFLVDTYPEAGGAQDEGRQAFQYSGAINLLLDVAFYYFTLHPTVASSLRLSRAIVRVGQHLSQHDQDGFEFTKELILRWTHQLSRSPTFSNLSLMKYVVPIELINILLSLHEFSGDGTLEAEIMDSNGLEDARDIYFQVMGRLYIFRDHASLSERKNALFELACRKLKSGENLTTDSQLTHLFLDLLTCPFIDALKREKLLMDLWPKLKETYSSIGNLSKVDAHKVVKELQIQPWFVRWEGIELLSLIEKKEWSNVYG